MGGPKRQTALTGTLRLERCGVDRGAVVALQCAAQRGRSSSPKVRSVACAARCQADVAANFGRTALSLLQVSLVCLAFLLLIMPHFSVDWMLRGHHEGFPNVDVAGFGSQYQYSSDLVADVCNIVESEKLLSLLSCSDCFTMKRQPRLQSDAVEPFTLPHKTV